MNEAVQHSDVLIVGGGLMGTTAAFFLRRHHGLSVTLLERELIGRQASGTNFGNVRRQGRDLAQIPLANRARAIWGRVHELLGDDLEFVPYGHLRVCYTEEQAAKLDADWMLDQMGIQISATRRKCALLNLKVVRGAVTGDASWPESD